jgi:Dolichyl-phosphate-mannose-protein mannosyltransferase
MTVEMGVHPDPHAKLTASRTLREPGLPAILALLAAFVAIWAIYATLTEAPVAIKHDMAEAYAWGREFQLGYNQHPPFWAWICGLWFVVFPRSGWAFALLSSLNAGIGLWGAWMLIGDFAEGQKRIAAWTLLSLTPLYTFYAYKYNANIIFLSIWPWAMHYFMKSLRSGRIVDAVVFGALIGLALMSKYYALMLVATCFVAALQYPLRQYVLTASPFISAAVAGAICAPHVWWLATHRAPPLQYLSNISGQGWAPVIDHATVTMFGGLGMNLGIFAVVGVVAWTSRHDEISLSEREPRRPGFGILATLALLPLVLTIIGGMALRTTITPEMTVGTFALVPLLTIEILGARGIDRLRYISVRLALALTFGALALSPVIALARTYLSSNAMKIAPLQEVAIEATRLWRDRTSLPLAYVAGSDWYENAIAFYSPDRPHVFVRFDYARNLWVTPEALAEHGLLSVCVSTDTVCLAATAAFATPETTRTEVSLAHAFWGHIAAPVHFVVSIIPPQV